MNEQAVLAAPLVSSRLLLISESEALDSGFRQHLIDYPHCRLTRQAALRPDCQEADLVLLDIGSYSRDDCLRQLRQLGDCAIALVNAPPEEARRLLELHPWIKGVFHPGASRSHFARGIGTLLDGGDWLPRALMERLLGRYRKLTHASQAINELTARERQILALAGKGLSNSEIAARLHLSTHTIKSHIHNALGKLGAANRAQAASLVLAHVCDSDA